MKTTYTIGIALTVGTLAGIWITIIYNRVEKQYSPAQLKLEEILSIKELHLVRHRYTDLFYLHRKGDPDKPVRAIAQVPVTITAYIDLKQIRLIKRGDSITRVILPKAMLETPNYEIEKMRITKTRSFQFHAGKDQYPDVSKYLQGTMATRLDTIRSIAVENHILEQAENEAKAYVESLLRAIGRTDITVSAETNSPIKTENYNTREHDKTRIYVPERYMGVIISKP
jgi:hypothetical protein